MSKPEIKPELSVAQPKPEVRLKTVRELVKELQSLPTLGAQKAFYEANPSLRAVIDPVNYNP